MKKNIKKLILLIIISILLVLISYLTTIFLLKKPTINNEDILIEENQLIVLISLDGLGSNLIGENTPFLSSLLNQQNVSYTLDMQTIEQSETMPSHVSMVTGLKQENHEFYLNSLLPDTPPIEEETLFDYALENGYTFSTFLTKDKLLYLLGEKIGDNIVSQEKYSSEVMTDIDQLVEPDNSNLFVFLHFRDIDSYGHIYGWNSNEQQVALKTLDQNLELLIEDIREEFQDYARYYIFTADHGGEGTQHSNGCTICRTIPLIIISENAKSQYRLTKDFYNIYDVTCIVLDIWDCPFPKDIDCSL